LGDRLSSSFLFLIVPFLGYLLACILFLLHDLFQVSWMEVLGLIFQWVLSTSLIVCVGWASFTLAVSSQLVFFIPAATILVVWLISNSFLVFVEAHFLVKRLGWEPEYNPQALSLSLIFSMVDASLFRIICSPTRELSSLTEGKRKELWEISSSFSLSSVFFRDLPFLCFFGYLLSVKDFSPPPVFISFSLCLFSAFFGILKETSLWIVRFLFHSLRNKVSVDFEEGPFLYTDIPFSSVPYHVSREAHFIAFFQKLLLFFSLPFVVLSFLPHFGCLFGFPFAANSIRGFTGLGNERGEATIGEYTSLISNMPKTAGEREESSWWINRGLFLLPLNLFSFGFTMLMVWPLLSLAGLLLGLLQLLERLTKRTEIKEVSLCYRLSLHWLLGSFLLLYFPLLFERPPKIFEIPDDESFSFSKRLLGSAYYVTFELLMPMINVLTDFLFSFQLLGIYQDPFLERKGELLAWVIVSFVATSCGALFEGIKAIAEAMELSSDFHVFKMIHHMVARSPFGNSTRLPQIYFLLRFLNCTVEDLLQILVATNTISFVGRVSPLWTAKLTMSLLAMSVSLGKLVTDFVLGKKITKVAKICFHLFYSSLFGVSLASAAFSSLNDTFCSLSRTINSPSLLEQLTTCDTLSSDLLLFSFAASQPPRTTFQAERILSSILLEENVAPLSLHFPSLQQMETLFQATGNEGSIDLSFLSLSQLIASGFLNVSANQAPITLSLPSLNSISTEGRIHLIRNQGGVAVDFNSLAQLQGSLVFRENLLPSLSLPSLSAITSTGQLFLELNRKLTLVSIPFLFDFSGEVAVVENANLTSITIPSLKSQYGKFLIERNAALSSVSLNSLETIWVLEIKSNPSLRFLEIPAVVSIARSLVVQDNPAIQELNLQLWASETVATVILIESNQSLRSIDIRSLQCSLVFSFIIKDNPHLQEIILFNDSQCDALIQSINNPLLEFVRK